MFQTSASNKALVVFKKHLVAFSLTFFAYALKLNLQPNINFFKLKSTILFTVREKKPQQYTNRGSNKS